MNGICSRAHCLAPPHELSGIGFCREHGIEALLKKATKEPNGCWLWNGCTGPDGYGIVAIKKPDGKKTTTVVHRRSYLLFVGEIPQGLEINHKCSVRLCVNPEHLETMTRSQNQQHAWDRDRLNGGRAVRATVKSYLADPKAYFLQWVTKMEDGCWIWEGSRLPNGYGTFRKTTAHRVAYSLWYGAAQLDGNDIDHTCNVKLCVNPAHLDAQTHKVNTMRRSGATETHFGCGHDRATHGQITSQGAVVCRTCNIGKNEQKRARRAGGTHRCGWCGELGHNAMACPQ